MITRRSLFLGLPAMLCAPAVVRACSLMKVRAGVAPLRIVGWDTSQGLDMTAMVTFEYDGSLWRVVDVATV